MQAHIIRVRRKPLEFYVVVCDSRAEAFALVRNSLELDDDVACELVGGLSDDEVARRALAPSSIIRLG
jgi:hypothetical protein